jgi:hypothetical protein
MEIPHAPHRSVSASSPRKRVLAIEPALGTVFACNKCEHIHLCLGDVHLRTDLAGFQSLVILLNRAAANFEIWAHHQRSAA